MSQDDYQAINKMRELELKDNFANMYLDDPFLIKYPPETVLDAYNKVMQMVPTVGRRQNADALITSMVKRLITSSANFHIDIAHGHRFHYRYEWNGHAWEGVKIIDRNTAASVAEDIYDMSRLQRNVREGRYAEAEELIDARLEGLVAMKNAYPDDKESNMNKEDLQKALADLEKQ